MAEQEYISLGFGGDINHYPFNTLESLMEELPKYEPLYRDIKNFEEVKNGEVSFFTSATKRTMKFTFFGKLDVLESIVTRLLEKSMPNYLFSYKSLSDNKSSKRAYKLTKKILTEKYGKELIGLSSLGEPPFDVITDQEEGRRK